MAEEPGFFTYLCARQFRVRLLYLFSWLGLVLNTLSLLLVDVGPAGRVVIAFNYVGLVLLVLGSGLLLWKCRQLASQ